MATDPQRSTQDLANAAGGRIERDSFAIIDQEAGAHTYTQAEWPLVRRMIHASADFDFNGLTRFHPRAVEAGIAALDNGCPIVADVDMIRIGLSRARLAPLGVTAHAFIHDRDVAEQAATTATTRAVQAMRKARNQGLLAGGIIAVGNAPTALLEIVRQVREEGLRPALVVGMPVGFVSAAESKAALAELDDTPWIITHGRKGGSTLVVAALHALLAQVQEPCAAPIRTGRLFGVSVGPGDPRLITRRAWGLLQRADTHWTYPVSGADRPSYALQIVRAAGLAIPSASAPLSFPMTRDATRLAAAWSAAAERVLKTLRTGTDVLFLVEGDASTYASFGHLAQAVATRAPEIAIETIPGVTSFAASAARLGMPLVDQDERLAVLPAGYDAAAVDRLLDTHDTLVLMKVKPVLDDVLTLLERRGLLNNTAFVEKAGTPAERLVRDVGLLRGQEVNYLSLLLVRNPHRRRSRPETG